MSVEGIKPIVINDIFSKGYLSHTGEYTMLSAFSPYSRNIRLSNQNTVIRPGYKMVASDNAIIGKKIRGITSNNNLYVALNSKLKSVNLVTGVYSDIGTLAGDNDYNFVNYGKYTIGCDGINAPYLYDGVSFNKLDPTSVNKVTIATGGSGYSVGDVLTIVQAGGSGCTLQVTEVNTGSVTKVIVLTTGTGYTVATTLDTTVVPVGGTSCTINITSCMVASIDYGIITTATIANGGTGYSVGDILTVTQSGASASRIMVSTVNLGVVTGITVIDGGLKYSVAAALATTVLSAGGTGCTLNITAVKTFAPQFGDIFINGVYLAGGGQKNNTLYISRGVTAANPEYCYDFQGSGSEKIYMKYPIRSIRSTLNRLFIFTDGGIEYISRETTQSVGGLAATVTMPITGSSGSIPASHRSVVIADDLVFFLTNSKQIKSLNYIQGITEAQVGNISERASQGIKDFMDTLDDNQSESFGYFNHNSRTVHRHLKTKGALFNDVVLVYDIINDTFLIDNNKFYSCATEHQKNYYTGSSINSFTYQDECGTDDDGYAIIRARWTKNLNFGNQNIRKMFRECGIVGQIGNRSIAMVEILVDGQNQYTGYIKGTGVPSSGLGSIPTGGFPLGGDAHPQSIETFQKLISRGDLRGKGYTIQVRIYGNGLGDQIVLSGMSFSVVAKGDTELSNKI